MPLAWVAQLVEHFPEEEGVGGSSPPPSTNSHRKHVNVSGVAICSLGAGSKGGAGGLFGSASRGREHLVDLELKANKYT